MGLITHLGRNHIDHKVSLAKKGRTTLTRCLLASFGQHLLAPLSVLARLSQIEPTHRMVWRYPKPKRGEKAPFKHQKEEEFQGDLLPGVYDWFPKRNT